MSRDDYAASLDLWHEKRLAALQADDSWLTVTGLDWLAPGTASVGAAEANAIRLSGGPAHLGEVTLTDDSRVLFRADPAAGASIGGAPAPAEPSLLGDGIWVRAGAISFHVIRRGTRFALRVHDLNAPARAAFHGIQRFPAAPSWRLQARREKLEVPLEMMIDSIIGVLTPVTITHRITFQREGQSFSLLPTHGKPEAPMLIFRDATSGRQTYGAARFLYPEEVTEDGMVLDFNKAINPPCAFTDHATCPLPPPENVLKVGIEAGEKSPG